jgi:hypothetical protein
MIKTSFDISNEERGRILSLHESATKKLYLIKEQVEVSFGTPKNTRGGSFNPLSVTATRDGGTITIRIGDETEVYPVPDKGNLEQNPNWLVTPNSGNETPLDIWVKRISGLLTTTDREGFYWVPTLDLMDRPVWVNIHVYEKNVRTKKGVGSIVGLGKKEYKQFAELVGTYPATV